MVMLRAIPILFSMLWPSYLYICDLHGVSQSNGGPAYANQLPIVKSIVVLASSNNQPEPAKAISSVGFAATSLMSAVAVPQARKASLAQFLEKHKERVMSASPYTVKKKSPDCNSPGFDGLSFSINSSGMSSSGL